MSKATKLQNQNILHLIRLNLRGPIPPWNPSYQKHHSAKISITNNTTFNVFCKYALHLLRNSSVFGFCLNKGVDNNKLAVLVN